MRNTQPLSPSEIADCQTAWAVLSAGACPLDVSEAALLGSQTRFDPVPGCVFLGADVMPGTSVYSALDELSYVAVLAHELTHFRRYGTTLENYVLEEVATHVQAAEILALGNEDRCALLRCGEEILAEYRRMECP